jgi:hypothetical protein
VKRRLFNLLAGLSLLLCVASAAVWVESNWFIQHIIYAAVMPQTGAVPLSNWHMDHISCGWGAITIERTITTHDEPVSAPKSGLHFRQDQIRSNWVKPTVGTGTTVMNQLGFARWGGIGVRTINGMTVNGYASTSTTTVLPMWFLLLISVTLPLTWLYVGMRRRNRLCAGACQFCGYDLRATPDRCPECWAIPQKLANK